VALQCVFDASLAELERIVQCGSKGTSSQNVLDGLRAVGIKCHLSRLRDKHENHMWWLTNCSYRWPIYVACDFVNQGKRGRPSHSHHAVLFANGMCYDGHVNHEEPLSSLVLKFNKKFVINDIIVIEHELSDWAKNMETA